MFLVCTEECSHKLIKRVIEAEVYMAEGNKKGKLRLFAAVLALQIIAAAGCGKDKDPLEKIKDLEFTVTAEENIPEELLTVINEKKAEGFKLTYQDGGFLYICMGYGQQETGGYSIAVNTLYETENAVYFDTTLLGPEPGENSDKKSSPSYPYVVVKTEFVDKPIVFN